MDFDTKRHEYERLIAMGRSPSLHPSARQLLIARKLDPSAWTDSAQEHINWCEHHNMTKSLNHFGGQFLLRRSLSLMQADDLLRELDRQYSGGKILQPLDAVSLSNMLAGQRGKTDVHSISRKILNAIFFMKRANGLPSPQTVMRDDGTVTLKWAENGRCAQITIDDDGNMLLSLSPFESDPQPIDFNGWDSNGPKLLATATDWIYFNGSHP